MSYTAITPAEASAKLNVELISNGIGTQALHETIVAYQANRRSGTHSTKTKATVAGSGKKPWRQKGTGNARAGYKRSPVWSGGGVAFGPHPRDYSKKTNKNVKQLALKKALSARVSSGSVFVTEPILLAKPSTKELLSKVKDYLVTPRTSILFITENLDETLILSARNHPRFETTTGDQVNAEQLLNYDRVIVTNGALTKLSERLQK